MTTTQQKPENSNPFSKYTYAICEAYLDTRIGLYKASRPPKGRSYKSMTSLLEESFLLGATRFGANFIA